VFWGPLEAPEVQDTYRLRHEAMGELDLFLVPIDPLSCEGRERGTGVAYQAVFS